MVVDHRARLFSRNDLVLILGAGVSANLTDGAVCSTWESLLENGIEFAIRATGETEDSWASTVRALLRLASTDSDPQHFVSAAGMIQRKLGGADSASYGKWLSESVGGLTVTNRQLFEVLEACRFPILTTNIDTTLTALGGQAPGGGVTGDDLARIARGDLKAIGYLHGRWDLPQSVVLGVEDYVRLAATETLQAVERALTTAKTLVYVGFGKGLDDPNLGRLLDWHRKLFGSVPVDHYRLCLASELDAVQQVHARDRIAPVPYGNEHSDLSQFLSELFAATADAPLTDAGVVRDSIAEAKAALELDLISASVLAETCNRADMTLSEAIVPPVLLPVPHSEWVRASSGESADGPVEPLDPHDELARHDLILLVGDDGAGLTTASKWLILESAKLLESAPPFFVDFKNCTSSSRTLRDLVAAKCLEFGLVTERRADLPELIVAVDNFRPGVKRISDSVVKGLAAHNVITAVVTCRQGEEAAVAQALAQTGREPTIRYLGRLGTREIATIARTVSISNHTQLANRVMNVVRSENLPRTPYSISLLMAVLERTDNLLQSYSQTAVLEQYVEMLLGRGDPHEDSRVALDHKDRQTVLARLARMMTLENRAVLRDLEVLENFNETFAALGWTESAIDLLRWFERQRLLRRDAGQISFTRTSYLYLFAAKHAVDDSHFLAFLLEAPLTYSSVIADYAAIRRNDTALLEKLIPLLVVTVETQDGVASAADGIDVGDPEKLTDEFLSNDEEDGAAETDQADRDEDTEQPGSGENEHGSTEVKTERSTVSRRELAFQDETEDAAFDESWRESHGSIYGLMRALDLVSRIVRDSDQVPDQEMKTDVLRSVLAGWGRLVTDLSADPEFGRLVDLLTRQLGGTELEHRIESHGDTVPEFLRRVLPPAFAWGGVRATLASRKLIKPLRTVQQEPTAQDMRTQMGAVLLEIAVRGNGWTERVAALGSALGKVWFVRRFLLPILYDRYVRGAHTAEDGPKLVDLCAELACSSRSFDNDAARARYRSRFTQDLKAKELIYRAREAQRRQLQLPPTDDL